MKKKLFSSFMVLTMVVVTIFGARVASSPAKEIELKYSSPFGARAARTVKEQWYLDWVEKESGGRVKFKRYIEGVLSSPPEQIKFIRNGAIDLGPAIITRFPDLPLTYLPVLQLAGESEDVVYQFSRMVNSEHPGSSAILQKEWEEKNVKFIGDGGIYYCIMMSSSGIMTKDFPFTSLADLKGKKLGSGVAQPELAGTGIVTVNVQRTDMYEALARGLIDGMMGSLDEMNDNKLYEVGKYIMEFNMLTVSAGGFLTMNRKVWNSLPADIQTIFEKGVDATYKQFNGAADKEHEAMLTTFRNAGITLGKFSSEENQMILDRINEIRRKDYLSICEKAGKLAEAELMVKYCDEILTKLKSR